ncbi:MAG: YkoF family thiamine/hydroxymethylpyrimidine-binding protein [Chloroflexota bacterium]|nr:YkoF family thiamine/hydroxymethylpyrimidine-binding protein [Chloroflexota bacterium]
MNEISAQISLYPLGQEDYSSPVHEVLRVLSERGLPYRMGSMSTVVWGDEGEVFSALREAFGRVAASGLAVMTITVSNACPLPETADDEGD